MERAGTLGYRQWYYRGSIQGCNFSCSYCPFSKKKDSAAALEKDKGELSRFVRYMGENLTKCTPHNAVLIMPYGEAMQYGYYYEALAKLSRIPYVDAVGIQSNFSFSIEQMLFRYEALGGVKDKLRLWGSFHPEMITEEFFLQQCEKLMRAGIKYSVGAVAAPKYRNSIERVRKKLPETVYFWLNRMDLIKTGHGGRKCSYENEDEIFFRETDDYFFLEMAHHKANPLACQESVFIEADGTIRGCNQCSSAMGNLYLDGISGVEDDENGGIRKNCTRKECSCYLSYCNLKKEELIFFEPYPAFRIPDYPKAAFFDVDGTLLFEHENQMPKERIEKLKRLAKHTKLFLATSLPVRDAMKKVKGIDKELAGGVFANGAYCTIKEQGVEQIIPVASTVIDAMERLNKMWGGKLRLYRKGELVYKIVLFFPGKKRIDLFLEKKLRNGLRNQCKEVHAYRILVEENTFQVTADGTGKKNGIEEICRRCGYKKEDVFVFGNSENDKEMLSAFPRSLKI